MKTPYDPRHIRRQKAIKNLFRWSFRSDQKIKNELAKKILVNSKKINEIIVQSAPDWPIEQINRVDLAILRLAIYELVIVKKEPPKVIIDEAVELAKRYGSEKSSSFVNGVLGTVLKKVEKKEKDKKTVSRKKSK
ncbi:MAG TPA: transcription antitermination factor NusB [Patescibacteria group bacterium]|nr:transcription antitermination factor NusB [Patescibacteria group bacterium]